MLNMVIVRVLNKIPVIIIDTKMMLLLLLTANISATYQQ